MSVGFQQRHDLQSHERAICSLSARSGAAPADVRVLFVTEFARLKMGAKVGSYLTVLTESSVRSMLRRKARMLSLRCAADRAAPALTP
jgi:hypothetical protein